MALQLLLKAERTQVSFSYIQGVAQPVEKVAHKTSRADVCHRV